VKNVKKSVIILSSFLAGALFATAGSVFAANIAQIKASIRTDLSFLVNGKKAQLNNEVLSYNGKTYLYLRDLEDISGVKIGWNASTKEISIESNGVAPETKPAEPTQPKLTPMQEREKFIANYKEKGIDLVSYWDLMDFLNSKAHRDPPQREYFLGRGYYNDQNGTDEVQYLSYNDVKHPYVLNTDYFQHKLAYIGDFFTLSYLQKVLPQKILDEYFQYKQDKSQITP
jgi:hypothetical protein